MPRKSTPGASMKRLIGNGKMVIGPLHRGLQTVEGGFRRPCFQPTELARTTVSLAISIDGKGDNRTISCCHLSCHPACHPAACAKCPQSREMAYGSKESGGHLQGQRTGG